MNWAYITLIVLAVFGVMLTVLWVRASRLDRLHRKVVGTRVALDKQLALRAAAAADLANSGLLDPASSILTADAAYAVLEHVEQAAPAWALSLRGLGADRELLESILTAMLREALGGADADETLAINPAEGLQAKHLGSVWYRAQLARRFHNEAVAQALHARRHWYVRLFRLAGRAPLPQTVELDDQMPPTLTTPSGG